MEVLNNCCQEIVFENSQYVDKNFHDMFFKRKISVQEVNSQLINEVKGEKNAITCGHDTIEISSNPKLGRYLTASRDILAGELLFTEIPLVLAPQAGTTGTCINCLKSLKDSSESCEGCGGPLCYSNCTATLHSPQECRILKTLGKDSWVGIKGKMLNTALTPLRTWLTVEQNQSLLPLVLILQSNSFERKQMTIGKFIDTSLVSLLKGVMKLPITREFIHHSCGIFDTNAFKFSTTKNQTGRALLPLAGLMNHDCVPNTNHWFDGSTITVRATCFIPRGAAITNSYTNTLIGTACRLKHLSMTKLFQCTCQRCTDPTELGTNLSYVKCRACREGLLIPPVSGTDWQCEKCGVKLPMEMVMTIVRAGTVTPKQNDIDQIEQTLQTAIKLLGIQHYGSLQLMSLLFTTLTTKKIEDLSTGHLQTVVAVSERLLTMAERLAPGLSIYTGELLTGNLFARAELCRRQVSVAASTLLPGDSCTDTTPEMVSGRLKVLREILKYHPRRPILAHLSELFRSIGMPQG